MDDRLTVLLETISRNGAQTAFNGRIADVMARDLLERAFPLLAKQLVFHVMRRPVIRTLGHPGIVEARTRVFATELQMIRDVTPSSSCDVLPRLVNEFVGFALGLRIDQQIALYSFAYPSFSGDGCARFKCSYGIVDGATATEGVVL